MAMIRYHREFGEGLSPEQIQEIEEAKQMPIVYDEDSPEITPEMATKFQKSRKRNQLPGTPVTVYLTSSAVAKAKAFGPDYIKILSNILNAEIEKYPE